MKDVSLILDWQLFQLRWIDTRNILRTPIIFGAVVDVWDTRQPARSEVDTTHPKDWFPGSVGIQSRTLAYHTFVVPQYPKRVEQAYRPQKAPLGWKENMSLRVCWWNGMKILCNPYTYGCTYGTGMCTGTRTRTVCSEPSLSLTYWSPKTEKGYNLMGCVQLGQVMDVMMEGNNIIWGQRR